MDIIIIDMEEQQKQTKASQPKLKDTEQKHESALTNSGVKYSDKDIFDVLTVDSVYYSVDASKNWRTAELDFYNGYHLRNLSGEVYIVKPDGVKVNIDFLLIELALIAEIFYQEASDQKEL